MTKELFAGKILNMLITDMHGPITITAILYVSVIIFVMLDLWSGLGKARRLGQYRSSYGLRKTVTKLASYFNMLLILTVIDTMQIFSLHNLNPQLTVVIPLFPILTFIGAVFVGLIEFKSIYEKANDKDKGRYQETAKLINEIIKAADKRDLSHLTEYLRDRRDTEVTAGVESNPYGSAI